MLISRRRFIEGAASALLLTGCSQSEAPVQKNVAKQISEKDPAAYSNGLVYNFDGRLEVWCDPQKLTNLIEDKTVGFNLPPHIIVVSAIVARSAKTNRDRQSLTKEFAAKKNI